MPRLAYDLSQGKVGCVLLQAAMGGDARIASRIDTKDWLLAPTPNLRVYAMTDEQVEQLVAMHESGAMLVKVWNRDREYAILNRGTDD